MSVGRWRIREHTGDIAFEVEAHGWAQLLELATQALAEVVLAAREGEPAEEERRVVVRGQDREDVLVAWLTEAVVLLETEGFLVRRARVEHAGATEARGALRGRTLAAGEAVDRVVKAVTYHDLEVVMGQGDAPCRTAVVLDL